MCASIKFTVACPICGNMEVSEDKLRGLMINRKLSLAADIISARLRMRQFDHKKDAILLAVTKKQLETLEQELIELGCELPNDSFVKEGVWK
jgi:hypothetical protein